MRYAYNDQEQGKNTDIKNNILPFTQLITHVPAAVRNIWLCHRMRKRVLYVCDKDVKKSGSRNTHI